MEFKNRSYTSGKLFRPKPQIFQRDESHLFGVLTPWGPTEVANQLWQKIFETFENPDSAKQTQSSLPLETEIGNRLLETLRKVHFDFYQNENIKQLRLGVEAIIFHWHQGRLSWARVGQPHLIIRSGKDLHPVAYEPDWSWNQSGKTPLLTNALGIESNVSIQGGTLFLSPGSELILVSRGSLPVKFFSADSTELQALSKILIDADSEVPFWLATAQVE